MKLLRLIALVMMTLTVAMPAQLASAQVSLNGAGATFPAPLYTKWFNEYANKTGVQINYQPIGSGGGIKAITDKTVDFGASDGIMTAESCRTRTSSPSTAPTAAGRRTSSPTI